MTVSLKSVLVGCLALGAAALASPAAMAMPVQHSFAEAADGHVELARYYRHYGRHYGYRYWPRRHYYGYRRPYYGYGYGYGYRRPVVGFGFRGGPYVGF